MFCVCVFAQATDCTKKTSDFKYLIDCRIAYDHYTVLFLFVSGFQSIVILLSCSVQLFTSEIRNRFVPSTSLLGVGDVAKKTLKHYPKKKKSSAIV